MCSYSAEVDEEADAKAGTQDGYDHTYSTSKCKGRAVQRPDDMRQHGGLGPKA